MRLQPSTFSIVACDLEAREWGVAVQSKFLGVGPVVPWAEAEVGAVATQSYANTSYGPRGLALMKSGKSAEQALEELIASDDGREQRQVGLVDLNGTAASFTGQECFDWAGHVVGPGYACQGNILANEKVVQAMAEAFETTQASLAERLLAALHAGQAAGGDRRGQQSASLNIVKHQGGYGGFNDRFIDVRVDDHARPIEELERIYNLHRLYFGQSRETITLDPKHIKSLQEMLDSLGYYEGDPTGELTPETLKAIKSFHNVENLEMRWLDEDNLLDVEVFKFLEAKSKND